MVELYLLEINNGMEYEDFESDYTFAVAENLEEAFERAKRYMEREYETNFAYCYVPSFRATLIDQVDGFKITVEKMEDEDVE